MDTNEGTDDGALNSTFRVDGPDVDDGQPGDEATPETQAAPEGQPQKVALSRREKARGRDERMLGELKAMREDSEKRDKDYRENLEAIRRENAELRGYVSAQPRQQESQRKDESPDPDTLEEQAIAALDNKDFKTYQRKMREAGVAAARRELAPMFAQQQQVQPQTNPLLLATVAQYGDVMGNPAAYEIAMAHDRILASQRVPDGPDRWKKALDEGRKFMGGTKQNGNGFSQRNREVVAGIPSGSNGAARGGGSEPGVVLTAQERETAKKYRMSEQEYAQDIAKHYPDRVVK